MNRFYTTGAPGSSFPQYATVEEAIEAAKTEVTTGKLQGRHGRIDPADRRYVVMVVARVEKDDPPVKVTRYDND